jgi:hypothetical protein
MIHKGIHDAHETSHGSTVNRAFDAFVCCFDDLASYIGFLYRSRFPEDAVQ